MFSVAPLRFWATVPATIDAQSSAAFANAFPPMYTNPAAVAGSLMMLVEGASIRPSSPRAALVADPTTVETKAPVGIGGRAVEHMGVPVRRLWVARLRHDRVCLHKASQRWVTPSGIVKVQPYVTFFALPGEAVEGHCRAARPRECSARC